MKVMVTITEDLYKKIMKYTNSKDISEAVNIALKDWMFFNRMKILNDKLSPKSNPHPFS
jgi:Arc/MetJ family transcription regulator